MVSVYLYVCVCVQMLVLLHVPNTRAWLIYSVKADASMASIRKTYRDLSQKFHPDKFDKTKISAKEAKEKFQEIARAYEVRTRAVW